MSTLTVESSRFGSLELDASQAIQFPAGLIGLGGHALRAAAHQRRLRRSVAAVARGPRARPPRHQPVAVLRRLRRSSSPTRTPTRVGDAAVDVWVTVRAGAEL